LVFGVEPVLDDALGEVNTPRLVLPRLSSPRLASPRLALPQALRASSLCSQRSWEATPRPATPQSTQLLDRKRSRTARDSDEESVFKFKRCWHCEPYMGKREEVCTAVKTLQGLAVDFEEQQEKVDDAEEFGDAQGVARRAARYFMYRHYVKTAFGFLGKGKRVRIPPCVIEHIRNRFREPGCKHGCKCELGGPLFNCKLYVGHRDAPDAPDTEE